MPQDSLGNEEDGMQLFEHVSALAGRVRAFLDDSASAAGHAVRLDHDVVWGTVRGHLRALGVATGKE
ncbi:MAG: hypothetical protein JW751_29605 [Polyangiaceae bacterium]|nr:hypothetical protein [Polyangiaceae bacterium]